MFSFERSDKPDIYLVFFRLLYVLPGVKMASQQQQQPGGPMAQPGLQQPTSLQQQQQQLSQQQDFDPVHRFKMLIPQLKESLQVSEGGEERRGGEEESLPVPADSVHR